MLQIYYTLLSMSVLVARIIMKKVTIEPGCIACGTCAFIAGDVFEVTTMSQVKADADIVTHESRIKAAVKACPVQVITYEEK